MNLPGTNQTGESAQITVVHTLRDLGIDRTHAFTQRCHDPGPHPGIGTANNDETLEVDPGLPGGEWRSPPSHVHHDHRCLLRMLGEHVITDTGESRSHRACQLYRTTRLKREEIRRLFMEPGGQIPSIDSEIPRRELLGDGDG